MRVLTYIFSLILLFSNINLIAQERNLFKKNTKIEVLKIYEAELREGKAHSGKSALIGVVAKVEELKPMIIWWLLYV